MKVRVPNKCPGGKMDPSPAPFPRKKFPKGANDFDWGGNSHSALLASTMYFVTSVMKSCSIFLINDWFDYTYFSDELKNWLLSILGSTDKHHTPFTIFSIFRSYTEIGVQNIDIIDTFFTRIQYYRYVVSSILSITIVTLVFFRQRGPKNYPITARLQCCSNFLRL